MCRWQHSPLITYAKTTKEAWDTLKMNFGIAGSIQVEDEGGSVETYLKRDEEFGGSHLKVDDNDDVLLLEEEKEHINAPKSHYAQLQVDDDYQ